MSWCCQSDTLWPSRAAVLRDRRWPPNTKIDPEKQTKGVCVCACVCFDSVASGFLKVFGWLFTSLPFNLQSNMFFQCLLTSHLSYLSGKSDVALS